MTPTISRIRIMDITIQRLSPGDGVTFPTAGDTVVIHYVGTLTEGGAKFDSSRDRNDPFRTKIGVGQVIKGWDLGIPQLSKGEKAVLICPSDLAYGDRGFPPVIPAGASLTFEVELIDVRRATS